MRLRYLVSICLTLLAVTTGCKKEKPAGVTKAGVNQPAAVGLTKVVESPTEEMEYFAVFMEGKKVGSAIQRRRQADGKVHTSEQVSITMNRAGIPITVNMSETSIETPEGKPLGFESTQLLGAMEMKMTGTVEPNGVVNLTTSSMGTEQKSTLPWPSGALMAEGLRLLSEEKGLKEGTEYSARVFTAAAMQALETKVKIGPKRDVNLLGRVVNLTETTTTMNMPGAGEIVTTSYVDDDLKIQKNLVPIAGMQIEMVACAKEFALGKNDVFEVINKMFVKSPEPLGRADDASAITYTLSRTGETDFNIPATDNQRIQRIEGGKLVLKVEPVAAPAGVKFPYNGDDKDILEAMKPNSYLQSDNEEIIKLARGAVGGAKDAAEAATKIEAFVAGYIKNKDLSVGYASAVEVARSKQGDCSEHAVLTAAMCRAVGIPAQIVTGIAYVDDWSGLQGFGGHAWVQAYIGGPTGKWMGLDAAFKGTGRGGHGPGHIALAVGNGEPSDFFNLATTLGKFKIDKVEVEK